MPLPPIARLSAAALFVGVALVACGRNVEDFAFETARGEVRLHSSASLPKGAQGSFLDRGSAADRTTARFTLASPVAIREGEVFSLTYRGTGGQLRLHLFEKSDSTGASRELVAELPRISNDVPSPDNSTRPNGAEGAIGLSRAQVVTFLAPLSPGTEVTGFRVSSGSKNAEVEILAVGVAAGYPGVKFDGARTIVRRGVEVEQSQSSDGSLLRTVIDFRALTAQLAGGQAQIVLTYSRSRTDSPGSITLIAGGSTNQLRYRVRTRPGEHRLYLYAASCGFTPHRVTVVSGDNGFEIRSLTVHSLSPFTDQSQSVGFPPIPADFGTIISYDSSWWRQHDFELFSWSLVPSVLVFDFQSLEVQSRYLKRLAFFVEKYGFAGTLWPIERLAALHGWNAHDYRPEDLARFFTEAERTGVRLNPEEIELRKVLVTNGVIVTDPTGYRPGSGAMISVSRSGSYALKHILLTHEGYHGIFFTHPLYRARLRAIWERSDPEEREIFRRYLRSMSYDVTDEYLVINEFGAYLMQQPLDALGSFLRPQVLARVTGEYDWESSSLAAYSRRHPELFRDSARAVEKALYDAVGTRAGELVSLEILD